MAMTAWSLWETILPCRTHRPASPCHSPFTTTGAPWSNSVVLEWFSAIQKVAPLDFGKDQGGALPEDTTYSIASETIRKVVA